MSCVFCLFQIHSSSSYLSVCMSAYVRMRVCALFACQPFFCGSTGADEYEVDQRSFQGPPLCMYAHGWSIMYQRVNWFPFFIFGTCVFSVEHQWSLSFTEDVHICSEHAGTVMRGSSAVPVQSSTISSPPCRPALKCNPFKVSHCLTNLTLLFALLSN